MKQTKRVHKHNMPADDVTRTAPQDEEKFQCVAQGQGVNDNLLRDYTDWIIEGWKQERPDLNVSPVAIINRLERLSSYLRTGVAAVFERFGLTGPSFAVIANLRRAGAPYQLSQRALMDILQLTSGTISLRIDRLVQDGLVERLPDPDDQRGILVHLTEKGLILFDHVAPVHLANEDRLLSALSDEQREGLASLLRILLLSFESISPEDPRHPSYWIGVSLAPAHVARQIRRSVGLSDTPGLLVQSVTIPSPASAAGLQEGDLIVSAGGTEIRSIEGLYEKIVAARGGSLTIEVLRGIERQVLHMPVGELSANG
jgi:DNA-binding MarR family transcriptional regulator